MDVFVIPIGAKGYALYCEPTSESEVGTEPGSSRGLIGRLRYRFGVMLRAAEERQHRRDSAHRVRADVKVGLYKRVQDRLLAWVAERIAEQRLLWNLRRQASAVVAHPQDMSYDQVMTLVRRILQRDYERHRLWLVIDTVGLVLSGPFALVPGPNILAYYFAFRVVGHWLSMRGAAHGMHGVAWTGRQCPPLAELRDVGALEPRARDARVHEIAARLRLQHLSSFFDRVAVRHA